MATAKEVLAMLKLVNTKQTMNYASKLASLLNFIDDTKSIRTETEVLETDLTIDQNGQVLPFEKVRQQYIDSNVNHFEHSNKEIKKLNKEIGAMQEEIWKNCVILRRKNTEEKKDKARARNEELEEAKKECNAKINGIIDTKRRRMEQSTFTLHEMREHLMLFTGEKIRIKTKTQRPFIEESEQLGGYTFVVPKDTKYYSVLCSHLGIQSELNIEEKPVIKRVFTFSPDVLPAIKKAIGFVSFDDLRPVFGCINIEISDGKMIIVATDAHRLFKSSEFHIQGAEGSYNYLLPAAALKSLPKSVNMPFMFYELADRKVHLLGINIDLFDGRFPDWKGVMPDHKLEIVFDRKDMIGKIKEVMVYSNKSTNQVNFNFNGDIKLSAHDIDFGYESSTRMNYESSTINNLEIGFNGKFLIDGLKSFKTDKITLKAESPTRAGIITDGCDTVLIMPLMLNN